MSILAKKCCLVIESGYCQAQTGTLEAEVIAISDNFFTVLMPQIYCKDMYLFDSAHRVSIFDSALKVKPESDKACANAGYSVIFSVDVHVNLLQFFGAKPS